MRERVAKGTPRIVFCDLDDTFLSTDKHLIDRNMAALDELSRRGIPFVPCTGRGLNGVLLNEALAAHPSVRYAITSSGSVVYDMRTREVIHGRIVGAERALKLYGLIKDLDTSFDIFADGLTYAERSRYERFQTFGLDPHMLALVLRSRTPVDLTVPEIIARTKIVERVGIFNGFDERGLENGRRAKEAVESVKGLRWTSAYPVSMEVVDEQCSKGEALRWLCSHLGIDVADSVAFGDSGNDYEMIVAAGTGVAMDNARPELKEAADMIAPANDVAGVAQVLEKLLGF